MNYIEQEMTTGTWARNPTITSKADHSKQVRTINGVFVTIILNMTGFFSSSFFELLCNPPCDRNHKMEKKVRMKRMRSLPNGTDSSCLQYEEINTAHRSNNTKGSDLQAPAAQDPTKATLILKIL